MLQHISPSCACMLQAKRSTVGSNLPLQLDFFTDVKHVDPAALAPVAAGVNDALGATPQNIVQTSGETSLPAVYCMFMSKILSHLLIISTVKTKLLNKVLSCAVPCSAVLCYSHAGKVLSTVVVTVVIAWQHQLHLQPGSTNYNTCCSAQKFLFTWVRKVVAPRARQHSN